MQWIFSFTADDGMGESNPTYHFNCRRVTRKVLKTGKRVQYLSNLYINESYFVFDAVGFCETTKEFYDVLNLETFFVDNHRFNCPTSWKYKIQQQISLNAIELFLNSNDTSPF
jgi:hypothetical protein